MTETLRYKPFQKQDLARGALHEGLIASLDTGLGKSIYGYTWALLKCGYTVAPARTETPAQLLPNAAIWLIVPGDLHAQMVREGWEKLRVQTRALTSKEDFEALVRGPDGRPRLDATGRPLVPNGFYITSFTQLATNGVRRLPDPLDHDNPRALLADWALKETCPQGETPAADGLQAPDEFVSVRHLYLWRRMVWRDAFDTLEVNPDGSLHDLERARTFQLQRLAKWTDPEAADEQRARVEDAYLLLQKLFLPRPKPQYHQLTLAQQDFVIREFLRRRFEAYAHNDGQRMDYPIGPPPPGLIPGQPETDTRVKRHVKCVFDACLADLAFNAFDCILLDEGVKMKGTDTYIGLAVRSLIARFRCILTATPIKNRLPDIFWLAWWAAGGHEEAHARFPYRHDPAERTDFAQTFMVSERNLTKEEEARANRRPVGGRFTKLTAEICNVHRLWKFLAPLVLRRRKDECGEDLVPRERHVIRVKMGTEQQRVYRYHLEAEYVDCNGDKAVGAQLQALRTAAADPTSACLADKGEVIIGQPCGCTGKARAKCPRCVGTGEVKVTLPFRGTNSYTPKFAAVLTLIRDIIARNEQVLVGTVFHESHDHLAQWLRAAGVPYLLADGRTNPAARGPLMQRFRGGEVPVCLAGLEAVANGHNLDTVNNVIIYAYSWAYDLIKQFLDRVWRLTSRKAVNVYVVLCDGTIDQRLESLNWEKSDSVELALDGRLIGEATQEINLAELLNLARDAFDAQAETVDEARLHQEWPALATALHAAVQTWSPDIPAHLRLPAPAAARSPRPARADLRRVSPLRPPGDPEWRVKLRALATALRQQAGQRPGADLWGAL